MIQSGSDPNIIFFSMNYKQEDLNLISTDGNATRWLMLAGVWLLYAAFGMSVASLAPLVSDIEIDLGIEHSAMGVVLGAWQFVFIVAAVPCGLLLDRFGSRHVFTVGALLMAGSLLGRSVAENFGQLLFAVGLFGLGGPIISTGAPKLISEWFEGHERGFAMGIYITGPGVGAILSLSLTNAVLMPWLNGDWRLVLRFWGWIFLVIVFIWLAIAKATKLRVQQQRSYAGLRMTIIPLLRLPAVRVVLLMSIGVLFFTHGLSNWLPELLRSSGMRLDQAGFWAAVPVVVSIFGALVIPRLAIPSRRILVLLILFLCAAGATLLLRTGSGVPLAIGLILDGLARSSMMTVLILTLVEIDGVGKQRAGTAGGLFFAAAEIGGVTGPITLGILYDVSGGFQIGLFLLTGVTIFLVFMLDVLRMRAGLP